MLRLQGPRLCRIFICMMNLGFDDIMDVTGTFSFALAGSLAAMEKRLDPFGVLIIAFATAIGGGTIRDLLLGNTPVTWLSDFRTAATILTAFFIALIFASHLKRWFRLLSFFDALGLGFFTLIGIEKAIDHHLQPGICVALGTITGCFGGVLRDVLLNKVPMVFEKEIYASASILGGIVYFFLQTVTNVELAYLAGFTIIVCLRLLALKYNWSLPAWYGNTDKNS
jgi:uncharacterized membrane protein YeiH